MNSEFALQRLHTTLQELYREGFILSGELHLTRPAVVGVVGSEVEAHYHRTVNAESVRVTVKTVRHVGPVVNLIDEPATPQDNAFNALVAAGVIEEQARLALPRSPIELMAATQQSDAPTCLTCGSLTVRSGSCYKCLNCGASLGCS